ncbi:BC1872 family protein [Paenibacillus sp. FSL K6-2524]|uniref:BC1872 family protein n=1 Tax=Paenibacillus sp. FSL K6-2524 TaxID=2954516 RepID=UPI0030F6E1BD
MAKVGGTVDINWSQLSHFEKDLLIGRYVMNFEELVSDEGIIWFKHHYSIGFWNFSKSENRALEIVKKLLNDRVSAEINFISTNNYSCSFMSAEHPAVKSTTCAETLQDAICMSALKHSGISVIK